MSRLGNRHRRFSGRSYQPPLPFVDGETRFEVFTDLEQAQQQWRKQIITMTSGNTTVNWNPPPHHAGPVRLSEITQTKADDGTYVMWTGDEWRSS